MHSALEDSLRKIPEPFPHLLPRQGLRTALLGAVGIIVFAAGCKSPASPENVALRIRDEIRHGQLDSAQRDAENALERFQGQTEWTARFRVLKGRVLMMRGSYSECLELLDRPLPSTLAGSDTEVERRMVQGLAHDYLQEFDAADQAISEAETLAARNASPLLPAVAQSRGILEIDRRDYPKAALAFRKAATLGRERGQARAELDAFANLGNVAMWQEHYDEAVDLFRVALEKSKALSARDVESKLLGNLGWSYSVIGDFDNAEISFKDAGRKAAEAGLVEDATYWLNSLGSAYFQQHRYSEADRTVRSALDEARKHDDKNTLTTCLNTFTQIALATGRLDDAEKSNREAIAIESSGQDQFGINSSQLLAGRIAAGKKNYKQAQGHFRAILSDPKAITAQKWEAHARLAELYAAQQQSAKAEGQFNIAIRTIQDARNSIESNEFRVSFLTTAIAFYDAYVNFLLDQRRPADALKIADLSRSESLEPYAPNKSGAAESKISVRPAFRPQETARRLEATLLFYWLGEQRSWLWVITPAETSLISLPPSTEIDAPVRSYRQAFLDPRDPLEAGNAEGKKLYELLVQPAAKFIRKDSRAVILPDGSLNSLNFESLIAPGCTEPCTAAQPGRQPHYWIEDVTITTANSISRLSGATVSPPPDRPTILLVGKALFASPDFPPIGQAGREIGLVENHFRPERRSELTDGNATPQAYLKSHPQQFTYIHFNAHGTASRLQPLDSAIILSPDGDSFKLYARDILKHPLSAYLVTISACNGSGIKTYAGEGLVGLSWAFLRAGAHHVIGGLWEVSNASTPQLMDELYNNLSGGQDAAAALRNAKLTLLHSSGNYRRPFYWAPFLLYAGS
jgi:CHAT domain-containing protein/Flp pilus assembly protein TadD